MLYTSLLFISKILFNIILLKEVLTFVSSARYDDEPGSSASIVSDYGLDDRTIGVRSPAGAKDFSSILCVQAGSGAHPASCKMGTGGSFPRG
jgi:hypothetical protein